MRSRDRIEIMSEILEAANVEGGAPKTRLMFNAFLGHGQLKHYLSILADNGLLQYDSISGRFKTTEKGLKFLKAYREIERMVKIPSQQQQQFSIRKNYLGKEEEEEEEEEKESLELKTPEQQ